jgi:hypothetical protein
MRGCWLGAVSLTGVKVYQLHLLLALASAVIVGFESHSIHVYILLSQIRKSPNKS